MKIINKKILIKTKAKNYISGDNCIKYGLNVDFLKEINVNLELINFNQKRLDLLKKLNIDIRYSVLDQLNKGTLKWQK